MKLHIIFGQRGCSYTGEYTPEALGVADEYAMDENPEWLDEKLKEYGEYGEYQTLKVIIVSVIDAEIDKHMAPIAPEIKGEVLRGDR